MRSVLVTHSAGLLLFVLVGCGTVDDTPPSPPAPAPTVPTPVPTPPSPAPAPTQANNLPPTPASCASVTPAAPRADTDASRIFSTLDRSSSPEEIRAALTRVDALVAANGADADAHYVRAVLLGALQAPPEPRFAAYERAFALDPGFGDAAYGAGVVRSAMGDHAGALAWFERAVAVDPSRADAQYNLGQASYNLGRYERALEAFLCARALTPEPFDETKKVVQALHALGRFDEAVAARHELWRIRQTARDPRLAQLREAVIDQLQVHGHLVMVSETAPPDVEPDLRYLYIARAYVREGTPPVQQVQLETSAVAREMGTAALIGYQQGNGHATTRIGFTTLPTYQQVRPTLEDVIGRLLRNEPLPTGASSRPNP